LLAGRDDISFPALSASAEGKHMIHGKAVPAHLTMTIIAFSFLDLPHPPARLPEATGLLLFSLYVLLADFFKLMYHRFSTFKALAQFDPYDVTALIFPLLYSRLMSYHSIHSHHERFRIKSHVLQLITSIQDLEQAKILFLNQQAKPTL
jgi:hypothetical protein